MSTEAEFYLMLARFNDECEETAGVHRVGRGQGRERGSRRDAQCTAAAGASRDETKEAEERGGCESSVQQAMRGHGRGVSVRHGRLHNGVRLDPGLAAAQEESVHMERMWEALPHAQVPAAAPASASGRQAIEVSLEGLHTSLQVGVGSNRAHPCAHRREALQVPGLWLWPNLPLRL